jgi:predicted membrane chloride channel (bestrophin family)
MHTRQADLNPQHSARIDASISVLVDLTGANERIFKSPIPLVYTRLTGEYIAQLYCRLVVVYAFQLCPTPRST